MIKKIVFLISGLSSLLLVPFGFYMSRLYEKQIHGLLGLQADPAFSGGKVLTKLYDHYGDDYGAGSLQYPLHDYFEKGTLDILKYTVFLPQQDAPWSEEPHFWQLSVTMAHFSPHRAEAVIRIYIDYMEGGSTSSPAPRQELVSFDKDHPWDLMAEIYGPRKQVHLYNHQGEITGKVPLYENSEENTYILRLPLRGDLEKILDGRTTYHTVVTGLYDEISVFQPLRSKPSLRRGGGAANPLNPRVFDILQQEDNAQNEILAQKNPEIPLIAAVPGQKTVLPRMEEAENMGISQQEVQQWEERLQQEGLTTLEKGDLLFKLGRNQEALEVFHSIQDKENHPLVPAYLGSLKAQSAKDKSPIKAVALVEEAFGLFNQALEANPDLLNQAYILIHRGTVSMNIPESVFAKAAQGAEDFLEAATLLEQLNHHKPFIKELYIKAAQCYLIAEMEDMAEITIVKSRATLQ